MFLPVLLLAMGPVFSTKARFPSMIRSLTTELCQDL